MKRLSATILLAAACAQAAVVTPRATDEILSNPGMGLCYYHYAGRLWAYGAKTEPGDTFDDIPGLRVIYMRVLWNDLEPEEGEYRWDIFDSPAAPFVAKGKKIGIRVICCNQTENAVPKYVRDAGAKGTWFEYKAKDYTPPPGYDPMRFEPDYDDPVFLAKYEKFLRAFAEHYDGSPDVEFVDVGSMGLYGEGHGQGVRELAKDSERYARVAIRHLELHRRLLPRTRLYACYAWVGNYGNWKGSPDNPVSRRMRELDIGIRCDSIFTRWWSEKHDNWRVPFANVNADFQPVLLEGGHFTRNGSRYRFEQLADIIAEYRSSYFSIHDFPRIHLKEHGEELMKAVRLMGYRLVPVKIEYPDTVAIDEPVEIRSEWQNLGVARCFQGARLSWSLVDGKGIVRWSAADLKFDAKGVLPTVPPASPATTTCISRVRFGHNHPNPITDPALQWAKAMGPERDPGDVTVMLKPGRYTLCVSLGTPVGRPEIALPIAGEIGATRRYAVGMVEVRAGD